MISSSDFAKKQIIFVFFNEGEKLSFSNDNIVVKDRGGKIKFQCSCYRLFLVFAVGHFSVTSPLIEKSKRFGFFIALMSSHFRLYHIIGNGKDGNTLLRMQQYKFDDLDLAKHIVINKIFTQKLILKEIRNKSERNKEAILLLDEYISGATNSEKRSELMAYEGLSAKIYFSNHFTGVSWKGRQPRIKRDYINSTLDIGYTLLFTFIEAILSAYGFDIYYGVLHKQFYMRKSLVCDIIEPFRTIVDKQVKKSINLKQIKAEDFTIINNQYRLKWEKSAEYAQFLMSSIILQKDEIFAYIQNYYRAFMKGEDISKYPFYRGESKK